MAKLYQDDKYHLIFTY